MSEIMNILFHKKCIYQLILLVFILGACSDPQFDDTIVAFVDHKPVTTEALLMNYETVPNPAPSKAGAEALRTHLNMMIQKQLFAAEGREHGFHQDPKVIKIIQAIKNDELRQALYRTQIEESIQISEAQLIAEFHRENTQRHVRHLFAKTEPQIQFMKQALDRGIAWEEIAEVTFRDSMLARNGGDLGWISPGEMEAVFEDTVFALPIGPVSQPVRTHYGYHLIQVQNVRKKVFATQDDFARRRPQLKKIIYRNEEKKRADAYVSKFMADKKVEMVNRTFNLLVSHIRDDVIDSRPVEQAFLPGIRDGELANLRLNLVDFKDEVLITYSEGQWTVADFLEKLSLIPVTKRPRLDSPRKFRRDLGIMIRNEFFTEEAQRQGLADDVLVQKNVRHWEDEYVFSRFWQSIEDTISVSPAQAKQFFSEHRSRYWLPDQAHIQEILVKSKTEAQQLLTHLKHRNFAELAREHSLRISAAKNGGDLGWISRGQMGNISITAFKLPKNVISEPIPVGGGFSIIKILGKRNQRNMTYAEAQDQVRSDVKSSLSRQVFDRWSTRLKQKCRIRINDSLLVKLGRQIDKNGHVKMPGMRAVY